MIYSNPEFLVFFLVVYALFIGIRNYAFRLLLLNVASLFFLAWAGVFDTLIFVAIVVLAWSSTFLAGRYPEHKNQVITLGITAMTVHLVLWKYGGWLVSQIQVVFPTFWQGEELSLPLPIGISFFTLQGIGYLIDYRRQSTRFMRFPQFILFKSFFGQLVAGPIARANQLVPQLDRLSSPKFRDVGLGVSLFVLGFFKKIAIADRVAPLVDTVFASPHEFQSGALVYAAIGYSIQIWADFSGYTDMGRGVSRMFGIKLPENFKGPYFATSPSQFWKRWHVTLSEWIRDYIYIPLGGSRGKIMRATTVVVFTMSLSGLWHGANWTFLAWGLFHGFLLFGERVLYRAKAQSWFSDKIGNLGSTLLAWGVMQLFIIVSWILFRSTSLSNFWDYLRGILSNSGNLELPGTGKSILAGLICCLTLQGIRVLKLEFKTLKFLIQFPSLSWGAGALTALLFYFAAFLRLSSSSPAFIYFQF